MATLQNPSQHCILSESSTTAPHILPSEAATQNPQHRSPSESFSTQQLHRTFSLWQALRILINTAAPQNYVQHGSTSECLSTQPGLRSFPTQQPLRIFKTCRFRDSFSTDQPLLNMAAHEVLINTKALTIFFTQQPLRILIMTADQDAPQYSSPSGLFST